MRRLATSALALGTALALVSCTAQADSPVGPSDPPVDLTDWSRTVDATAAGLPELSGPYSGETLVADGLQPPTNSWLAGAVFNGGGQPLFTGVLSVRPLADSVSIGLPVVASTEKAVFGSARDDVVLGLGSSAVQLDRVDALSATFGFTDAAGEAVADLTVAQGWPYAQITAKKDTTISVPAFEGATIQDGAATKNIAGTDYVLTGADVDSGSLDLSEGDSVHVYALPPASDAAVSSLLATGAATLESTSVAYSTDDADATTTYEFATVDDEETVFASRVHQTVDGSLPAYDTLYGAASLTSGTSFSFSVPTIEARPALDLSALGADERSEIESALESDVDSLAFTAPDSYGGSKQLYRASMLYALAAELDRTDLSDRVGEALRAEFDQWLDPAGCVGRTTKCFVYDPILGGLTGMQAAYGSDEFNDHHFHYGYLLYALGVLASYDQTVVEPYRAMADAISADIASLEATTMFPERRSFDDYTGHSWASGTSPFADGNNQESASEAVHAWAGLSLWAEASENTALATEASWLLSTETATAQRYWLGADLPDGFTSPFFALNWGGKRDYATFFDATPSAILGIELIPMSPSTAFLPTVPGRAESLVDDALTGSTALPLIDYVVMYQATIDQATALETARSLPDSSIDGADSRSYLLAWIHSQNE